MTPSPPNVPKRFWFRVIAHGLSLKAFRLQSIYLSSYGLSKATRPVSAALTAIPAGCQAKMPGLPGRRPYFLLTWFGVFFTVPEHFNLLFFSNNKTTQRKGSP
jgi:hypothetical protein